MQSARLVDVRLLNPCLEEPLSRYLRKYGPQSGDSVPRREDLFSQTSAHRNIIEIVLNSPSLQLKCRVLYNPTWWRRQNIRGNFHPFPYLILTPHFLQQATPAMSTLPLTARLILTLNLPFRDRDVSVHMSGMTDNPGPLPSLHKTCYGWRAVGKVEHFFMYLRDVDRRWPEGWRLKTRQVRTPR